MDQINNWLEEIKNRFKEQNIDISDCYILFERNELYFNGESIKGVSESKDGKWVCIPVYDEEASDMSGSYVYYPHCFEVKDKFTTYLSNGVMSTLTTIWLLYK